MSQPLLEVKNLKTYYPIKKGLFRKSAGFVKAVDGVTFSVMEGETFGLVGESGCGKSTTGRTILRLIPQTEGEIVFQGRDISSVSKDEMRRLYRDMQLIFQDPYASLNPRKTVGKLIEEPLIVHNLLTPMERKKRVQELLEVVGLHAYHADRYPHEFSGGQRQRIGIARALALNPKLIIADEPVSALDVSIQSQVLNLLRRLQQEFHLTYLFIAHDLSVVKHISDRVGVMYLGRIVEQADKQNLFDKPLHPYTQALLSAVPVPKPNSKRERIILEGDVPSPANPPQGCAFHPRCFACMDICRTVRPELTDVGDGHYVACHLYNP
ncbi:ABC transporter ATP-binding protein [Effusibacillus pohliae]|uniref:ABC transporter ATP-binding protein n=1 Tax=Effusibacillus pohliae TaxID=232270 RepID=UPI00036D9E2A|nr:dipeptide ABC transporter ATP-binding protein [Effusibacillus pohliae]